MEPTKCGSCGMPIATEAEAFVHEAMHQAPRHVGLSPPPGSLSTLHFVFIPAVAKLCEEYARRSKPSA